MKRPLTGIRLVTGTQRTRWFRVIIASLFSLSFTLFLASAVIGLVKYEQLGGEANALRGDVQSVAALFAFLGFIGIAVLLPITVLSIYRARTQANNSDVQNYVGAPISRSVAVLTSALSVILFIALGVVMKHFEITYCSQQNPQQGQCTSLLKDSLIVPATVLNVVANLLTFCTALVCLVKGRQGRKLPSLVRSPHRSYSTSHWPSSHLHHHRMSTFSTTSSAPSFWTDEKTVSRQPSTRSTTPIRYHASVLPYANQHHERKTSGVMPATDMVFVQGASHMQVAHHPANGMLEYKICSRAPTPPPVDEHCQTYEVELAQHKTLREQPSYMSNISEKTVRSTAPSDKRKRSIRRKAIPSIEDLRNVDTLAYNHQNRSFVTVSEFHDAVSSAHERLSYTGEPLHDLVYEQEQGIPSHDDSDNETRPVVWVLPSPVPATAQPNITSRMSSLQ